MVKGSQLMKQVFGMESNKTTEFLLPYLVYKYPYVFQQLVNKVNNDVVCGIGDTRRKSFSNCIYMLVRFKRLKKGVFKQIIEKIRTVKGYKEDYLYGDYLHDFHHMIVLEIEPSIFNNFINGKYSKMFENPDIIFNTTNKELRKKRDKTLKVLKRDKQLIQLLADRLGVKTNQILELASDFKEAEEIFNYGYKN